MPTIPTGKMELELRRLYVRWLSRLGDETNMDKAVDRFEKQSIDLIEKMGGRTAMLGALADFPAPKRLDLSPHIGTIYSDMKQAAIQAGIQAGLNASDVARHMFRNGMDKSFHRLNRLARTETVSAYWKNAWDSIDGLPDLVMVWGSEDGPRTCAWCRERDGMVMESSQLRDHPNGRCTPIPTLRSMVEYKGSVDAGGRIYQDPAWTKKPEPVTQAESFTYDELRAMQEYQKGRFDEINAGLRAGEIPAQHQDVIRQLDNLIAKNTTTEDLVVNRTQGTEGFMDSIGLQLKEGAVEAKFPGLPPEAANAIREVTEKSGITADWNDWDFDAVVGKIWRQDSYLSTSLGKVPGAFTGNIDMQIEVPAGSNALVMASQYEEELLIARGSAFKILSMAWDATTNRLKVRLELIQ